MKDSALYKEVNADSDCIAEFSISKPLHGEPEGMGLVDHYQALSSQQKPAWNAKTATEPKQ